MVFWKRSGGLRVWLLCMLLGLFLWPLTSDAQYRSFFFDLKGPAAKAEILFQNGDYEAAIPYLELAVNSGKRKQDDGLVEMLAYSYAVTGQAAKAADLLKKLANRQDLSAEFELLYVNTLVAAGHMEEGRAYMQQYLRKNGKLAEAAELVTEKAAAGLYRDSVRYSIRPVGFNTEASEYGPQLIQNNLIFVSDRPRSGLIRRRFTADGSYGHDLFVGQLNEEGEAGRLIRLSSIVNSPLPEGPAAIFEKDKKMIFTRSGPNEVMGLYEADRAYSLHSWVNVKPLQLPVEGAIGHPTIQEDGQVIYFVSDMPGGYGGADIYRIKREGNGWGEAQNMGPAINTAANELFPRLHGNNKLYFASNGHFGLGGLDIFEARLQDDTVNSIRNLGAPVNSEADDFGISLHESGDYGYFSSNRKGGKGKDDIYRLDVHIITLAGVVFDKTNQKKLEGVQVYLRQGSQTLASAVTNAEGAYTFRLYPGQEYALEYEAEEFRAYSQPLSTQRGPRYGIKKWETGLDRKVKMFVLGTIRNQRREFASGASLLVIDQTAGRLLDTVYTDARGNYELELDAKSRYAFWAECNGEGALVHFSTPEKGKASLSYYENMHLTPSPRYLVKGRVKGTEHLQAPVVLSLFNRLSLEQSYIFADEAGNFSFEAHSLADYELCVPERSQSKPLLLTGPWKKPERMVELVY